MSRRKIIIPIIIRDEIYDFPSRTASAADVFTWIRSRCSLAQFDFERGPLLSQAQGPDGYTLHNLRIPQIMGYLRNMGFEGRKKGMNIAKDDSEPLQGEIEEEE